MITVIRTATAFPGMTGEALSWAKEIATLVKRVTGKEQIVCSSFGGMLAEIAWIGQYDSVGQYDEMRTKILIDGDYRTALKKARGRAGLSGLGTPLRNWGLWLCARAWRVQLARNRYRRSNGRDVGHQRDVWLR